MLARSRPPPTLPLCIWSISVRERTQRKKGNSKWDSFLFFFFCVFSLYFFCICSQCYAKVFLFFLLLQVSNCPCKLTQDATLVVGFWFFIGSDCNVLIWFLLCLVFWWIIFCEELLKVTRVSHCKRNNIARSSQHFCSYTLHLLLI